MNSATARSRQLPVLGTVAGLLLVSACSSSADSTSSAPAPAIEAITAPTTPETSTPQPPSPTQPPATTDSTTPPATTATTAPPTTATPTTAAPTTVVTTTTQPPISTVPVDAVDVADGTVFDVRLYEAVDVDTAASGVSARLGSPTTDTGWQSTAGQVDCAGSTEFRVLWWGDFRMTFERYQGDDAVRDELSAWTVGDPTVFQLAPIAGDAGPSASEVVTQEGIGLGATRADIQAAWEIVHTGGPDRLVVLGGGGGITLKLDDSDQVVGFGGGPFDCPVDELR